MSANGRVRHSKYNSEMPISSKYKHLNYLGCFLTEQGNSEKIIHKRRDSKTCIPKATKSKQENLIRNNENNTEELCDIGPPPYQ